MSALGRGDGVLNGLYAEDPMGMEGDQRSVRVKSQNITWRSAYKPTPPKPRPLRHQPNSALSQWFKAAVIQNGGRYKKTAIIALARKLFVALWKYMNAGVVIEGARLTKPSA